MADNDVFADVFNYYVYDGKQIIKPESLQEKDSVLRHLPYEKSIDISQRTRDILKYLSVKNDGKMTYVLLGIENQTDIHYAMPIRSMLYDALQYDMQLKDIAKVHDQPKVKEREKIKNGEFLSGYYRNDKLIPVITLVVYWGTKPWDGPISLHEMLDVEDERILSMIPDYPLHLISPESMSDEDLKKIKTNLREVLQFVKYSKNKQMLEKIISGNERYKKLDKSAVQVMKEMTGLKIDIVGEEKEDMIDMCQAWEEMREDARLAGIEEGIKEGEIIGYIRACKELILQDSEIIHKLREKYELSNEEAQKYLQTI